MTGISFPVATDLCTRFATQIVLRRAPADEAGATITISLGLSAQADETAQERLLSFDQNLPVHDFDNQKFLDILEEVWNSLKVSCWKY
jgi:hypothetical protein